jgi:hypothetical protein
MVGVMSESDPSGYRDSPDTTDPDGTGTGTGASGGSDGTLTTDDSAQREDSVERPGNEPD